MDRRFIRSLAGSRYAEVVQAGRLSPRNGEATAPNAPLPLLTRPRGHGRSLDKAA